MEGAMLVPKIPNPLLAHQATENGGSFAATKSSPSRLVPPRKSGSSDSAPLSLVDALLHDAPGIMLLLDAQGNIRSSTATARAVWERIDSGTARLHDIVDAALAREWGELLQSVLRDRAPLALRGVVKGEWLWAILRHVESAGTAHVLLTLRPMTQEAIHTPPAGVEPGIRIIDAINHDLGPLGQFSKREIEVLSLIGVGLTTGQIAKALHRSLKTVENHRTSIGRKLNARSLLDLCRVARRAGMPESTPLFSERVHGKGESPMMDGK
jgi:DNA-binding NarL/FixJ family response regulator